MASLEHPQAREAPRAHPLFLGQPWRLPYTQTKAPILGVVSAFLAFMDQVRTISVEKEMEYKFRILGMNIPHNKESN